MFQHFWLICGLWCGVGNGVYARFRLRKHVGPDTFSLEEITRFARNMALWILVPSLLLWGLQLSTGIEPGPMFPLWPSPQKYIAVAIQFILWSALVYWVFARDGASKLSTYYGAGSKAPSVLLSPLIIKLGTVLAVVAGLAALFNAHA